MHIDVFEERHQWKLVAIVFVLGIILIGIGTGIGERRTKRQSKNQQEKVDGRAKR